MARSRKLSAVLLFATLCSAAPILAKDVVLDLSDIAPVDAKTAPAAPKQPQTRSVEMHPDDVLIIHCPVKSFPGDKGWIEYHTALSGPGCLISTMTREAHSEAYQATGLGLQKVVVGLKQPGANAVENDCQVSVKVVASVAQEDKKGGSPNVQSFAGQTVFGNKTSATKSTVQNFSQPFDKNQGKPASHSVEEQSKSTVKTY